MVMARTGTHSDLLLLSAEGLLKVLVFLKQGLHAVKRVTKVLVQKESLDIHKKAYLLIRITHPTILENNFWVSILFIIIVCGWIYLLLAHPVVDLLCVPVEELQVHALLVLLPTHLPQLQQRLLLLSQYTQLHTHGWGSINLSTGPCKSLNSKPRTKRQIALPSP